LTVDYHVSLTGIHARNEKTIQATQDWERNRIDTEALGRYLDEDVDAAIGVQQRAGADFITDGQLTLAWQDLFRPISSGFAGLEPGPMVRWFNTNTFFFTPVVKGEISSDGKALSHAIEKKSLSHGSHRKLILPDPFTFSQLADDQYYNSKESLLFAYSDAVNMELRSLSPSSSSSSSFQGVDYIQFSAPSLVCRLRQGPLDKDDLAQLGEAVRNALKGVSMRSGFYPFFGDASPYLPDLFDVIPTHDIGLDLTLTDDSFLSATTKGIIAGIVDSRTTYLEDIEALASRIRLVAERTQAKRLTLAPSADLRYIPRASADEKVELLGRLREALVKDDNGRNEEKKTLMMSTTRERRRKTRKASEERQTKKTLNSRTAKHKKKTSGATKSGADRTRRSSR
jgi:5-methyltetrahydropteroyltriglutamate--homocysteine methyltransferase